MRLNDKVAVVTGGSGGLGSATARLLASEGARIALVDLDVEAGERLAHELDGLFLPADVSELDQNVGVFEAVERHFGAVDRVHLNAGIATGCALGEDFSLELYRRAMGVNIDGVVFGVHAALPALRRSGGGAIVATASLAGLTAVPMDPIYAANKHAVVGLVRSLGTALAGEGVRINAICPGFAESAIIEPIREAIAASGVPIIPAQEVAAAVLELMDGAMSGECWYVQPGRDSEAFRFRNVPGHRS
ncbi:MAG: SDR family NAD(P)-dependent oxidoreductase [Solirubrobacteraceae bacterium]